MKGGIFTVKNNRGQIAIWVIVGIALIALGIFAYTSFGGEPQQVVTTPTDLGGTGCSDSTGILTVAARSELAGASAPSSPTITCGVDGGPVSTSVTSGTTTFPVGAKLQCLVSKSDFIDKSFSFVMPCGGKTLDAGLYYSTSDNPVIRIKNDDGDFMTDGGGATNQTNVAAGETFTLEVEFQGTNTEASGDGIYVIEFPASSNANISTVTMSGLQVVPIPSVHTLQNAGAKAIAFKVPSIVGAEKKSYSLQVALGSAKDLSGTVLTDWYASQNFVDDDYSIGNGVEDSDGTAKYENTLDYDFVINSA